MKDFSGGDTENSTMKAGKTNMGRLSKVEISGVNTSKLPVLSREEAKVLFQQARAGSEEARQTLIQGNLRLVLSVIKKFDGRNENPDDLFQVGCVGLIKGIDNFSKHLFGSHDCGGDSAVLAGQQLCPGVPLYAGYRV